MKKRSARTIVITGAGGDIAQALISRLSEERLILLSRSLPQPVFPEKIDILINNAGFGVFEPLSELTDSQIEESFRVNVLDLIKLTRDLKPVKVVNIASIAGKLPTAKSTVYAATKAAVIAFSDALRLEGVPVLTVNTGPVRTKFHVRNEGYLAKVGRTALSADFVAQKIVKNLESGRRELNLPWTLAFVAKLRALCPRLVDFLSNKFFNYK